MSKRSDRERLEMMAAMVAVENGLRTEIASLQAIVASLPKDEQGRPLVVGDPYWTVQEGQLIECRLQIRGYSDFNEGMVNLSTDRRFFSTDDKDAAALAGGAK